jgi:hypothetical protein
VFFANKRTGFLKLHGLEAEDLCERRPGLVHVPPKIIPEGAQWRPLAR